ncbi:MAG: hypothetical protein ACRDH9_07265 [Actinomycetota bacterium]
MGLTINLIPLEAVLHEGEELVLILSQGHANQMPSTGSSPVELEYGNGLSRFEFTNVDPRRDSFFVPPTAPVRIGLKGDPTANSDKDPPKDCSDAQED